MEPQRSRASAEAITFRNLVKDCAEEPQLVESFNRAYGASLAAPITALLDDRWPLEVSPEEELLLGCFIVFIHEQLWVRLRRVQARPAWSLDDLPS
ncbi:MAG TPA: hypothetical protein VGN07_11075 [Steroidobacteraceae bacterium]|jgi:hypothetical protein